jgi:Putative transposase
LVCQYLFSYTPSGLATIVVTYGAFSEQEQTLQFFPAMVLQTDIKQTEERICSKRLRYLRKRKILTADQVDKMLAKEKSGFSLDASVCIQSWDRRGLERLLRYCGRPSFASENIRWNGKKVTYNLSKPNHRGQTSTQLDPIEFIDRIATLIPIPYRHRRHYFGVFAPNSPLRKQIVANAKRHPDVFVSPPLKLLSEKVRKVSLDWATLIARIYEVNPLICSTCGGRVKIVGFVTHRAEILRILYGVGWPVQIHAFDPEEDFPDWSMSQLVPGTSDGFPEIENQAYQSHWQESYCDPPHSEFDGIDLPHSPESYCDPPHEEVYDAAPPHEWD